MPSRSLRILVAASVAALIVPAGTATAATKSPAYPTISKVSPAKLGIGDTLTIAGKNFRSGKYRNTVVLKKDGGRAIFLRVAKASTKSISIKVPAKLLPFLKQKNGAPVFTRFRVRILAARFGRSFTTAKKSPMIGPTAIGAGKATKNDCDGDGKPNSTDTDDDADLLSDTTEKEIGTDACKRDSDGDGMSDGWEYRSALDRNDGAAKASLPSPNRKPYANPLDKTDGDKDQDGDGLTNEAEYAAWATFSNNLRTAPPGGSVLTFSGGNPASDGRGGVPSGYAYADRDQNGFLSDFERDADHDGIPNMDEGGSRDQSGILKPGVSTTPDPRFYDYGLFTQTYIDKVVEYTKQSPVKCAGVNQVPFYCADQAQPLPVAVQKVDPLDWLAKDTDGDGVPDDGDDQDHDGINNMTEYLGELQSAPYRHFAQLDACVPNPDSYFCLIGRVDIDGDGQRNDVDTDDDGDGISDARERQILTDPLMADTDGDGVTDGFEYYSALDLNSAALPFPGKRPYPNALDKDDADKDFDQDSLTLTEEFKAWLYTGAPFPLSYSDGTKYSGGRPAVTGSTAWEDLDGNGVLSDDEEDVDDDGLTNFDETHGRMTQGWWTSVFQAESKYPGPEYAEPSFVDPDTDGDSLKDGADDQDHDGYTNAFEVARPANWATTYVSTAHAGSNPLARVQPYNPCKPTYSDYCHPHAPLGYYGASEDWASPVIANGP
jgi:hypothetical protein